MNSGLTREMIEQAKAAESPEELLRVAKENGIELTKESAEAYYEQFHANGELSDEELSSVSGGGCHYKDGRLVVTVAYICDYWTCKKCGGGILNVLRQDGSRLYGHPCPYADDIGRSIHCDKCQYMVYEHGLWLCNNPANKK